MNLALLWSAFLACTVVILYSGSRLSRYGDIIAEKSGLGKVWIGVILLAFVTSLPELFTGLSAVIIFETPDIAAGDIFGSCVFNMLILGILDIFDRASPISSRVQQGHTLSAGFGILLLSIATVNIILSTALSGAYPSIAWIGMYTPLIILLYLLSIRLIFFHEKRILSSFIKEKAEEFHYREISLQKVLIKFSLNALVVVVAAVFLPKIGKSLAELTGLGQTFVGNIFIAISTSLPEIVVSISALKMGAGDMAIGNLFGSNLFNISILAVDDLFFTKGPLLSYIETEHVISALSAIIMMTIAVIGLTYRARKKRLFIAWDALGIMAVYTMNLGALYILRAS